MSNGTLTAPVGHQVACSDAPRFLFGANSIFEPGCCIGRALFVKRNQAGRGPTTDVDHNRLPALRGSNQLPEPRAHLVDTNVTFHTSSIYD